MIREHFPKSGSDKVASTIRIAATNLGIVYIFWRPLRGISRAQSRIELIFRATETSEEALRGSLMGRRMWHSDPCRTSNPADGGATLGVAVARMCRGAAVIPWPQQISSR